VRIDESAAVTEHEAQRRVEEYRIWEWRNIPRAESCVTPLARSPMDG
jgi:hypothetical protein